MARLRALDIPDFGGFPVRSKADYLGGCIRYTDGTIGETGLPSTDAVYYGLDNGQFVCIRPSGTEPKLKIYVLVYDSDSVLSENKAAAVMNGIKQLLE